MNLQERLNDILSLNLAKDYTAVSYAMMVDGEILAAGALGNDGTEEKKPVTTEHTFNVCSISKVFCTTAVMQLVEQGKVELDKPVCEYLPKLWMPDERYRDITVRHLLNHASGMPGTQWKNFSATHVGSPDNAEYYQEVYDYLAKSRLKAAPGSYSVYCNDGFTVAEMVVAAVSGMPFGEYCKKYITEPIGAHSTRPSTTHNSDYPLVKEAKKPEEYFYLQGCGGFTTNMIDLCKFGNIFLTENDILSEESKAEMRKHQGVTFLEDDNASTGYGLGWDNVAVNKPEFDLGEHVQMKGGNSFQFTSALYVIPKYNAVLAISETHDCRIDVNDKILSMFATALLEERGINIVRGYQPVPQELIEKFDGTYLVPGSIFHTHFFGTRLTITNDDTKGNHNTIYQDLKYNGKDFMSENGERHFFREHDGNKYFFYTIQGRTIPGSMKANDYPALSEVWEKRIGKKYIVKNLVEQDMVGHEMMNGFTLSKLEGIEGVIVASFSSLPEGDVYTNFEACVKPLDDDTAEGFLQTPCHGSRDLVDPCFEMVDGVEHCHVASYYYMDEAAVPKYSGETFASELYAGEYNSVYRLEEELKEIPEVPEGRRLIVMNKEMSAVYDSQTSKEFKEVKEGYITFI